MDLQEAFDAGFKAVKTYVDDRLAEMEARLAAVEARQPEKGERGESGPRGPAGDAGAPGRDGKDGTGLADGILDREGHLVLTMTDGRAKTLGVIVGRDGEAGAPGRDGVGFDDMEITLAADERTLTFAAQRGETRKEWPFRLSHVLDRGVWQPGTAYVKGDGVTWSGSFWIAQEETSEKPDTGKGWRLAVKRGRDGREPVKAEK